MQSLSFMAYRRTSTHLLNKWETGSSHLRPIDHRNLEVALAQDQACTKRRENSEAALSPSKDLK